MALLSKLFGPGKAPQDGWIETGDLAKLLAEPSPPLVIDVRGPDEFTGPLGHIHGAVNIPLPAFGPKVAELLAEARPLVMVCHTDRRSLAAAAQLRQGGATAVTVLRGGMVAWRARP
jgi:rhodanese-related sulfurtransferase